MPLALLQRLAVQAALPASLRLAGGILFETLSAGSQPVGNCFEWRPLHQHAVE
jgi:hypothetical protein